MKSNKSGKATTMQEESNKELGLYDGGKSIRFRGTAGSVICNPLEVLVGKDLADRIKALVWNRYKSNKKITHVGTTDDEEIKVIVILHDRKSIGVLRNCTYQQALLVDPFNIESCKLTKLLIKEVEDVCFVHITDYSKALIRKAIQKEEEQQQIDMFTRAIKYNIRNWSDQKKVDLLVDMYN